MVYIVPTPTLFKARYPEFASVSDELVQLVLNDAIRDVHTGWCEDDRTRAQMLLTAHWLSMQGYPLVGGDGAGNGGTNIGMTGAVKRIQVGDVVTEFAGASGNGSSGGSAGSGSTSEYALTTYGRQYLTLLRSNFAAVAVL